MNFTIRTATLADAASIALHNNLMAQETEGKTLDMHTVTTAVEAAINDPSKGFYLVADSDGQNAGNLMVTYEWSDWRNCNVWWIQSVYVAKKYRRQGIYKALYQETRRLAQKQGVKIIRLYVEKDNKTAQATYEKLGMKSGYYLLYETEL